MSKSKSNILLIGHRGANILAPENTLKSFQKAIDLKADYVEFDVMASKDGEIVVIHDESTFRTANYKGKVKEMSLQELKQLDFGEGEQIPTLKELVELCKGKIGLQCEIKVKGISEKIIKILTDYDIIDSTIISSFEHDILSEIKHLDPSIKTAALEGIEAGQTVDWSDKKLMIENVIKNKFEYIHPHYLLLEKRFMNLAHENNIKINTWTVDSNSALKKVIKMGVDGIITNDIELAKEALNRK